VLDPALRATQAADGATREPLEPLEFLVGATLLSFLVASGFLLAASALWAIWVFASFGQPAAKGSRPPPGTA
jgi:hypothetical protein